jgi:hypothetical protein
MAFLHIAHFSMKKILLLANLLITFLGAHLYSQQTTLALQRNAEIRVFNEDSTLLPYPWTGGFNFCQVGTCDVNNDNLKDLVIFDRTGDRITLLQFTGTPGNPSWVQNIEAEPNFPDAQHFMIMKDFNCDGKEDIFTFSNSGIRVYKNDGFNGTGPQFSIYSNQLKTEINNNLIDIFTIPVDVPAFEDLDSDGDLDLLVFNILGSCVEYHRNYAQEDFNRCDTLVLKLETENWGRFTESFSTNEVLLNDTCESFIGGRFSQERHAGSALTVFDSDGDNDYDLLLGDIAYRTLTKLINGGNSNSALITSQIPNYPDNTTFVNLAIFPAGFYLDVNQDGKRDLIVTPNSETGSENYRCFLYYLNEGEDNAPVFNYQGNTLFTNSSLDFGEGAIPYFFDHNLDGKKDLLVGNYGYFLPTGDYKPQVALLENISDETEIRFQLKNRNYAFAGNLAGISVNFHPTTGDLDNDGDQDLLLGASDGRMYHFENTALPGNPANMTFITPAFEDIDVGTYATPCLFDVDQNGRVDLLIGNRNGKISYYKNTSTGNSPVLELQTEDFGGVNTALTGEPNGFSTPFMFRKNGITYLISGSQNGFFELYGNIDNNLDGQFQIIDSTFLGNRFGERTSITLADLNDDGNPEAVIGNYAGGITFFDGIFPTLSQNIESPIFKLFPNPGQNEIYISANSATPANVSIFDASGRLISTESIALPGKVSRVPEMKGLYFIQITNAETNHVLKWIHQ